MKWCIKVTEENLPIVGKWFNENSQNEYSFFNEKFYIGSYFHYPTFRETHIFGKIINLYTELTFEQFKEQILKEQNVLNEILDKIRAKVYYNNFDEKVVELDDIEEIFSNYLNK